MKVLLSLAVLSMTEAISPTKTYVTTAIDWENWGVTEARDSEFVTEKSHPFYDAAWYAEWQAYKESLFSLNTILGFKMGEK